MTDLIPDEWFDPEALMGEGRRFRHPGCSDGKDRALVITRTPQGWVWWCHRCREKGFKSAQKLSPQQTVKWLRSMTEKPVTRTREVQLPQDFTTEIPLQGLAWLYSRGITDKDIQRYSFGYSPYYDRVILPVFENSELVYWTGRYLGKPDRDHPKWSNMVSKRKEVYFKVTDRQTDTIVLVEDIPSALKVGEVSDCYALLSTFVSDTLMFGLSKVYKRILIWLDSNKRNRMTRYTVRYRSFGLDVRAIRTKRDPKMYSTQEIKEILK